MQTQILNPEPSAPEPKPIP